MRLRRSLLVVLALLLVGPAVAAAAPSLKTRPCADRLPERMRCATLGVPLDHSGAVPGRLRLAVRLLPAAGDDVPRGAFLLLAGGPGQSGLLPNRIARRLERAAPGYDLVQLAQRGTGPGALRCDMATPTPSRSCARDLGPKRRFYTSLDSAADIDDLRLALGGAPLTLGGVSYGTWVAQVYARAYPQGVARLVLDSVVGLDGVAGIATNEFAAARRILAQTCADDACQGITGDVVGDTSRLSARMARTRIRIPDYEFLFDRVLMVPIGGRIEPGVLVRLFTSGDFVPAIRAAFPAAMRSALRGDTALLGRLLNSARATDDPEPPSQFSDALYLATTCAETRQPWRPDDRVGVRVRKTRAAAAATPREQLAPWGALSARWSPQIFNCLDWPRSPFARRPDAPLPDVPAFVVNGVDDVRTPLEDAQAVAAALPRSTLIAVPNEGHSVLLSQGCARRALRRFLTDAPVPAETCADAVRRLQPFPLPPRSLKAIGPRGGGRAARARRTAESVRLSVADALEAVRLYTDQDEYPGLRGGTAGAEVRRRSVALRLDEYRYVPGVQVSGRVRVLPAPAAGRLVVAGRGVAAGTLRVRDGVARGRLGGVRVRVRITKRPRAAARALTAPPPVDPRDPFAADPGASLP